MHADWLPHDYTENAGWLKYVFLFLLLSIFLIFFFSFDIFPSLDGGRATPPLARARIAPPLVTK